MTPWKRVLIITICNIILLGLITQEKIPVRAQEAETPHRQTTLIVPYIEYEWWLLKWANNQVVCQLLIEHEGVPTSEEVYGSCGKDIHTEWSKTPPCQSVESGGITTSCPGLYFYFIKSSPRERTVIIDLPLPKVWITLSGCVLSPPANFCQQLPSLLISGEEPLPNEHIVAIHASLAGNIYTCQSETCEIPLLPTTLQGLEMEVWADSSFGDSSPHFSALVRVLDSGVPNYPGGSGWFIDVLSSQWKGSQVDSCAQVWQAFPPVGGPPPWLTTPSQTELLASDQPYYYLAGRLIDHGLINATDCPGNGLLSNGYANACGLDKARPMVNLWQNQFDPRILKIAEETDLPAQLMKRLFAQESQFWPGIFRVVGEYGLGQMTSLGADAVLLWNQSFFDQFCPLVLDESVCERGYLRLMDEEKAILRGALAFRMNADCQDCPTGIDLTQADFSVHLFAQSLLANCDQVSRTIYNATNSIPGTVSTYDDLWRFTLVNYHAGPGCLAYAVHTSWLHHEPLDWEHVSANLTDACQGAVSYVDLITR